MVPWHVCTRLRRAPTPQRSMALRLRMLMLMMMRVRVWEWMVRKVVRMRVRHPRQPRHLHVRNLRRRRPTPRPVRPRRTNSSTPTPSSSPAFIRLPQLRRAKLTLQHRPSTQHRAPTTAIPRELSRIVLPKARIRHETRATHRRVQSRIARSRRHRQTIHVHRHRKWGRHRR